MAYKRRFSRRAYQEFELLADALIENGTREIDILLRLNHIVESCSLGTVPAEAVEAPGETEGGRLVFEFFGYGLECQIDHESVSFRVTRLIHWP